MGEWAALYRSVTVFALSSLLAVPILSGSSAQQNPQVFASAPLTFDRIYLAYTTGDYDVLGRRVARPAEFEVIRVDLEAARRRWTRNWQPIEANFLLEIAVVAYRNQWNSRREHLETARRFVVSRPAAIGADPAGDAWELMAHRVVFALLHGAAASDDVDAYVRAIGDRVSAAPIANRATLVERRLPLFTGIAAEQRSYPSLTKIVTTPVSVHVDPADHDARDAATAAIAHFDVAAAEGSTRDEAIVRRAFARYRLGRPADALAGLDDVAAHGDDATLRYLACLIRGLTLETLGRPDDAERSYEAALTASPRAQSAGVALAALEFRRGKRTDAWTLAESVRAAPPSTVDPFGVYWWGDLRFFETRLTALRRSVQ